MKKIETHIHSEKLSICSDVSLETIVERYHAQGYKALTLTNHINWACNTYPYDTHKERMDYYFSGYEKLKNIALDRDMQVFYGAEICTLAEGKGGLHQDFIILGFEREFLYKYNLYDYNGKGKLITQQQLFELAQKYNFFMYQAHPFRSGERTGDPNFMHGAEAFNCHYHHDNFNAKAQEFCEKYNLVKMSGTDFHHPDQPIIAGAYIPDTISDESALANFYKSGKAEIIVDEKESQLARQKYIQRQKESK